MIWIKQIESQYGGRYGRVKFNETQTVRITGKTAIYQIKLRIPKVSLGIYLFLRVNFMMISQTVFQ